MHFEEGTIISEATLRDEDLITKFWNVLPLEQREQFGGKYDDVLEWAARASQQVASEEQPPVPWEVVRWFLWEKLVDALNTLAPKGCYFGAHPGDGACFGFWRDEEYYADQSEGLTAWLFASLVEQRSPTSDLGLDFDDDEVDVPEMSQPASSFDIELRGKVYTVTVALREQQ
jgi:hypothetical protein